MVWFAMFMFFCILLYNAVEAYNDENLNETDMVWYRPLLSAFRLFCFIVGGILVIWYLVYLVKWWV